MTDTRRIIDDRWVHLRADDCRDVLGREIAPYYVLEQAEWVNVVALTADGRMLIVDEYRHGAGEVMPGLPAGALNPGEEPAVGAARELAEETGYAGAALIDLGWVWANAGNQNNRAHYFLATDCVRTGEQRLDASELIDVRRVPFAEAGAQLRHGLALMGWYKAQDWLATH